MPTRRGAPPSVGTGAWIRPVTIFFERLATEERALFPLPRRICKLLLRRIFVLFKKLPSIEGIKSLTHPRALRYPLATPLGAWILKSKPTLNPLPASRCGLAIFPPRHMLRHSYRSLCARPSGREDEVISIFRRRQNKPCPACFHEPKRC